MKQRFDNSILLLDTNPHMGIKVEYLNDSSTYTTVYPRANKADIVADHGSIKAFFERLNSEGKTTIRITDRKSNGSTYRTIGEPYTVTFSNDGVLQNNPTPKPVEKMESQYKPTFNGLAGSGLGMVEIHRIHDYDRIKTENTKLEAKVEQLTATNEKLKEDNLRNELLGVKKVEQTEANGKLIMSAQGFIPLIQAMMLGAKGAAPAQGLGEPASEVKQFFINLDDPLLLDLVPVAKGLQNEEFETELQTLLIKFNLITA